MTLAAVTGAGELRDQRRLAELEAVVERGLTTFIEVGEALTEIRGSRLYRRTHDTFEDYCRDRFGFSRQRAHQLMDASAVVRALPVSTTVDIHNERQARALVPVLRERGPEAVVQVLEHQQDRPLANGPFVVIPDPDTADASDIFRLLQNIEAAAANLSTIPADRVPARRRAATAKRLREVGTLLGRLAWLLEAPGGPQ